MLNPKWYESMLATVTRVRQIEAHLTNTMGWSATTGEVQPWVYQRTDGNVRPGPADARALATLNPTASARLAVKPSAGSTPPQLLVARRGDARRSASGRRGTGKIASKASMKGSRMNLNIRMPVRRPPPDGEGSVQVQLDPSLKIGTAKVFAVYGKGGIGKEHDFVESVGRLLHARQARAADRMRSRSTIRRSR